MQLEDLGAGAVFSYDPIGCIERLQYTASGAGEPMIIPFFDCQVFQSRLPSFFFTRSDT